jgi:hypothetical protein
MQPVAMGKTVACPHCRQEIFNDPDLAGTVVACPACQGQFTLPSRMVEPPASMVEPPPVAHARPAVDRHESPERRRSATEALPKNKFRATIRIAMLAATALWLVTMPVVGLRTYRSVYNSVLDFAPYATEPALYNESLAHSSAIVDAFIFGFIGPTVPYGIVMTALGVVYFAARHR